MSFDNYRDKDTYSSPSYTTAKSSDESERLRRERAARITDARETVTEKASTPRPTANHTSKIDSSKVRKTITSPKPGVEEVYAIPIDNSGSNRQIADHFKKSAAYLRVNLNLINPNAQFVFAYFSDHTDGDRYFQAIDFVSPDDEGELTLISTLHKIYDASGDDAPEAHECVLNQLCDINFGDAKKRHLIMVSDVVGHGMGMEKDYRDNGCPYQQDWHQSLKRVNDTYTTFEFIGCGNNQEVSALQKNFISLYHPELVNLNFIDLSDIQEHVDRMGIVLNTFLFLVARNSGLQSLEAFLARLYEKWLSEPIFGSHTDSRAKEAITRFCKFINISDDEVISMLTRILSIRRDEAETLFKKSRYSF